MNTFSLKCLLPVQLTPAVLFPDLISIGHPRLEWGLACQDSACSESRGSSVLSIPLYLSRDWNFLPSMAFLAALSARSLSPPPPCTHAHIHTTQCSGWSPRQPLHTLLWTCPTPLEPSFPSRSFPTLSSHVSFCSLSRLGPSRSQLSLSTTSKERSSISHPNRNKRHSIDLPDIRKV